MNKLFIITQIFAFIGIICNITAMQINKKKKILIFFSLANIAFSIHYYLLNAISGAIVCLVEGIEAIINNNIEKKKKKIPIWLIIIYILIAIILSYFSYKSIIDLLAISAAFLYIVLILLKKEKSIRTTSLIIAILWLIYDLIYKSVIASFSDILLITSTAVGIYRFDIKGVKNGRHKKRIK